MTNFYERKIDFLFENVSRSTCHMYSLSTLNSVYMAISQDIARDRPVGHPCYSACCANRNSPDDYRMYSERCQFIEQFNAIANDNIDALMMMILMMVIHQS